MIAPRARAAAVGIVAVALVACALMVAVTAARAAPYTKAPRVSPACDQQHPDACRMAIAYWRGQALRADAAVVWQRHERWHAQAISVQAMTRDAIAWAADKYGKGAAGKRELAAQMTGIGTCESHLWPWATNGQYMSWAQLSDRHRSDPVIAHLTWRDPYAVADHVARYLLAHGEGEWQCRSTGGLRW